MSPPRGAYHSRSTSRELTERRSVGLRAASDTMRASMMRRLSPDGLRRLRSALARRQGHRQELVRRSARGPSLRRDRISTCWPASTAVERPCPTENRLDTSVVLLIRGTGRGPEHRRACGGPRGEEGRYGHQGRYLVYAHVRNAARETPNDARGLCG